MDMMYYGTIMMYEARKLMCKKVPLWGGMAGMCGHGCMMQMIMMLPVLTLNTNARA